ncbi:ATP phosphoribosyltransferase regulatory subunit [Helicobacter monodelphidis]|uniref:ATP phosphoribosyltransferase regulatory subunit n=1 Tax=Helicobacter sp. 15-1451 TaxID=2004995 RepID=UPI00215D0218|nr:ATP phosphoribosyltransferase regulatory subunit [Helicobacter sp. 15-1451]
MILEHEIPPGGKLYFGESAKIKREIECRASELFTQYGFLEILTPTFSYLEHQRNFTSRNLVRLSDESNQAISLRIDSTLDVMRILTKRLLRQTHHKKWFYIQPIFIYPTEEVYQIGIESIDNAEIQPIISLAQEFLSQCHIHPLWQLSNMNIPKLCSLYSSIPLDFFTKKDIPRIIESDVYLKDLLYIHSIDDLKHFMSKSPHFLLEELQKLLDVAESIESPNIIIAPLDYPSVPYYHHLFFRAFLDNRTLLSGGLYEMNGYKSSGFGIFTDEIIVNILKTRR